ncbi:glutathione S-transferase [Entomortierella parvispora]|uniref:Glutathione S-transferase n=1 Tax=Entomortierella parvispora TaxID=205924 RepID=A0A9P3H1Q5_9FUNG|nr:glutathione S-transferase [Entomortierella parvispora]
MSSPVPKLYMLNRNYSSWSLRAWLAMRALNIELEPVMLIVGTKEIPDLGLPAANELMLRAGPTSKVPALHVEIAPGKTHIIFESLAIMEYLAEDYPSLWPADRYERAYARSLSSEMATGFFAVRNYAMNLREHRRFQPELFNERVAADIKRLSDIWEELRSKAAQNKGKNDEGFLFGTFTALDAMYAPIMFRFNSYDLASKVEGEHAQAYMRHMLQYGPMKEWAALASQETEIIPRDELPLPL